MGRLRIAGVVPSNVVAAAMNVLTSRNDGHTHVATIDLAGNGKTTPGPKDGHVHEVKLFKVETAGTNPHYHVLTVMGKQCPAY